MTDRRAGEQEDEPSSEVDLADEWTQAQGRVIDLVEPLAADEAARRVPACPDWTVRDLLAHMIGLDADALAGDEPDDHNSTWTQRQVDARSERDVAALVEEWRRLTAPVHRYISDTDPRPLGDIVIHEQDLRSALGAPGARDTDGLAAIRDQMAGRFAGAVEAAGLAPAVLAGGNWTFATHHGTPGIRLEADPFDLARALTSRRSADQLRSWVVEGDIEPYLDHFTVLGPLPDEPLPE